MNINIHIYNHPDPAAIRAFERIERKLSTLQHSTEKLTAMTKAEAARLDKITNDIKARFAALIAKLADQPTTEEQAEIDADFATLEGLGADTDNPIPA